MPKLNETNRFMKIAALIVFSFYYVGVIAAMYRTIKGWGIDTDMLQIMLISLIGIVICWSPTKKSKK